jgi:hypothetical protein
VTARCARLRHSDSIFKQPLPFTHAQSFSRIARGELVVLPRRRARGLPRSRPINEGHGAPRGANVLSRFRHRVRSDGSSESASPCGAPLRRFWARGPYFRVRMGERLDPLSGALSRAFVLASSSRERQSHVVGPDGDLKPPGRSGCEPCAQAPHPAPPQSALEKRPSRTGHAEHKCAPKCGDCYPHHKMFRELQQP